SAGEPLIGGRQWSRFGVWRQLVGGGSSLGDLGFDLVGSHGFVAGFPDDRKPAVVERLDAVVDRRCGAFGDHCLGSAPGIAAITEGISSGVHRYLLLDTTTHTLFLSAQSTGIGG